MFVPKQYNYTTAMHGTIYPIEEFKASFGNDWGIWATGDSKRGLRWYGVFENAFGNYTVTTISFVLQQYLIQGKSYREEDLEIIVLDSGMFCLNLKYEDVDLGWDPEDDFIPKNEEL